MRAIASEGGFIIPIDSIPWDKRLAMDPSYLIVRQQFGWVFLLEICKSKEVDVPLVLVVCLEIANLSTDWNRPFELLILTFD